MSNNNIFDLALIGAGVSGAFSALRVAEKYPDAKTILLDFGAPPLKRKQQILGWLGCFPSSDGKLYLNDFESILKLVDGRKAHHANKWVMDQMGEINSMKEIKDSSPQIALQKRIKELNFEIQNNDYIQWKPESIHQLSRYMTDKIESAGNIKYSFDTEVYTINKKRGNFIINTSEGDIVAKKIVLAVGRSGWRWATELYKNLDLTTEDDYASFGIRVEISSQHMKEFNRSHCSLIRPDLEIGPFSWQGTVIPEDHTDLVISAFRSNEDRWKSDKVSFSVLASKYFKDQGVYQTDRLGKLAFLLFNDRVSRERIKAITKNNSQLSLLPEYNWLTDTLKEIEKLIPNLINRGYFHVPNIMPLASKINLNSGLETDISGMFVAGESARIKGILGAAVSGTIAVDSACK